MTSTNAAATLFASALEKVESKSIREWATTAHNAPLFLKIAESSIAGKKKCADPEWFAAYIVATAIGL